MKAYHSLARQSLLLLVALLGLNMATPVAHANQPGNSISLTSYSGDAMAGSAQGSFILGADDSPVYGSFGIPGVGEVSLALYPGPDSIWEPDARDTYIGSMSLTLTSPLVGSVGVGLFGGATEQIGPTQFLSSYLDIAEGAVPLTPTSYSLYSVVGQWDLTILDDRVAHTFQGTGSWAFSWDDPIIDLSGNGGGSDSPNGPGPDGTPGVPDGMKTLFGLIGTVLLLTWRRATL